MKHTTDWDLTPLDEKHENMDLYYNVNRLDEKVAREYPFYRNLKDFMSFIENESRDARGYLQKAQKQPKLITNSAIGCPVKNLEFVMFTLPSYEISIDVVSSKDFLPGGEVLKEEFYQKIDALESVGWQHLYVIDSDLYSK